MSTPTTHEAPVFQHDCDFCKPLGRVSNHDLYFCPRHGGSLVARFGSEEAEYRCLPADMVPQLVNDVTYGVIIRRARAEGLLPA